jgi:hypothetical protein
MVYSIFKGWHFKYRDGSMSPVAISVGEIRCRGQDEVPHCNNNTINYYSNIFETFLILSASPHRHFYYQKPTAHL